MAVVQRCPCAQRFEFEQSGAELAGGFFPLDAPHGVLERGAASAVAGRAASCSVAGKMPEDGAA